ncbi:hypothetical protein D9M70_509480 [compost metagenome]
MLVINCDQQLTGSYTRLKLSRPQHHGQAMGRQLQWYALISCVADIWLLELSRLLAGQAFQSFSQAGFPSALALICSGIRCLSAFPKAAQASRLIRRIYRLLLQGKRQMHKEGRRV